MSQEPAAGPPEQEDPAGAGETAPGADLPDLPLFALLRVIAQDLDVDRIDTVWLFPPRRLKAGETSVLVVSTFHDTDRERRRVHAAQYTAPADPRAQPRLSLDEFGTAPAERVGRLVEEVVERIKDDAPPGPPRTVPIQGQLDHWHAMLHELAQQALTEAERNPRLPGPI